MGEGRMKERTLIVYYSQAVGNTKKIAEKIQRATGADIFKIDTVIPYEGTSEELTTQGQQEVDRCYKPELKVSHINLDMYDRFIIGTPVWWYSMAPAMRTFLASNDWTGKKIVPFITSGGSPGHAIDDIKNICRGAVFEKDKSIQFDSIELNEQITTDEEIEKWILSLI